MAKEMDGPLAGLILKGVEQIKRASELVKITVKALPPPKIKKPKKEELILCGGK